MEIKNRRERAAAFDQAARTYEAVRPSYADGAIKCLIEKVGLSRESLLLEVGAGTGQATRKLAPLGCPILALEPGKALAEVAREVLSAFPNVQVINESFETFGCKPAEFDLIVAATSFHWTDPETRWQRAAELIKPGGYIAILTNKSMEVCLNTPFYQAASPIFARYEKKLADGDDTKSATVYASRMLRDQVEAHPNFKPVFVERFPFDIDLSSDGLIALHETQSNFLRMAETDRVALLSELRALADREFGGRVVKPYESEIVLAKRP